MTRMRNQKNIVLAVFFCILNWIREDWRWGIATFIMCLIAFSIVDWLKAPFGQGPLDRFIGNHQETDNDE